MRLVSVQPPSLTAAAAVAVPSAPAPPSVPHLPIPILPRLTPLPAAADDSAASVVSGSSPQPDGVSSAHTEPPAAVPSSSSSSSQSAAASAAASSDSGHSALNGLQAEKRPAPRGLYDSTAAVAEPPAAARSASASTSMPAASSSTALVAFHAQLTAPHLYGHAEAIKVRADIEAHYVHFLRCWQQRANIHLQLTTGAVAPLIDAHSKLQQTFAGQYATALEGGHKGTAQHADHSLTNGHAASHRPEQQHQPAVKADAAGADGGGVGSRVSEAQQHRDIAVAAAVDEVRKSVRKRRPPRLLAEDDEDGQEQAPAQATVKKQRQAERKSVDDSIADERPSHSEHTGAYSNGRTAHSRPTTDAWDDLDVIVVEDASSQPETAGNRPRRSATATRKRDVLLAHHYFRHFSLRCYSISNPPAPPPSSASSPPHCSASVNYQLYMQSQAMLKAQFPKIGKADQPSTSYYACLCVEPLSPYYAYCTSLLPPRVQASISADSDTPLVLSAALFDLCDGLYFRILFFTSPYTTNGFATLLLAHLRLLAVRLHNRLIVCATKAQKQFWLSCGFRDAAQHWGGLNFGDTMLLNCELMDEAREEEQRRRMASKSEERLKVKATHFKSSRAAGGTRQRTTNAVRHTVALSRADNSKRTGFNRANNNASTKTATAQPQRDRRPGGKELVTVDPKRTNPPSSRPQSSSFSKRSLSAVLSSASTSASPSDAVDPLQVYHPYIVRSIHSGKLLPIRGPPLAYHQPASSPSPFVPEAAVMCVTQQSAYHKGGTLLVTFTLQRGLLIELKHKRSTAGSTSTASTSSSDGSSKADERIWRVKLFLGIQGKRGGGVSKNIAEQFMYPLGDDWRERYGLPPEQPDDALKEDPDGNQTLKEEEADNDDDDDSESGSGNDVTRTRSVPELVDLVDDSDESTNPTPDPLNQPQQPQAQNGHKHKQPHSDVMDVDDDGCSVSDERSMAFDHASNSKQLSTPTLHTAADTDTPSSPLALPLPALDEHASSPDLPASRSPSPSPSPALLPPPLTSPHSARLQLILPMSPTHAAQGAGEAGLAEGGLASHGGEAQTGGAEAESGAEDGAEVDGEEEDEPGLLEKRGASQLMDGTQVKKKFTNGYFMASAFGPKMEGEAGVSIFAMMSTS